MSFHFKFASRAGVGACLQAVLLGLACSVTSAQTVPGEPPALRTVAALDLARYQGTWYQLALYPNRFQAQCVGNTRAHYALQGDGTVRVTNLCRTSDGSTSEAVGQARPAKSAVVKQGQLVPPQLEVRFAPAWLSWLPRVWGDYWVIQLAEDYRYVVVGEPQRAFLWVLARNPTLPEADWLAIDQRLKEQGYDPSRLVREKQLPAP